jgi:hypothetical protein
MPDLCQFSSDYDAWPDPATPEHGHAPCFEPAIAVVTLACVHEHIDSPLACAGCAAEIQRVEEFLICRACETCAEPHECAQTLRIRWTVTA